MLSVLSSAPIRHLQINRPELRNALDAATYQALTSALLQAQTDPYVQVIVLSGNGPHFCAGNDLRDFQPKAGNIANQTKPALDFLHQIVDINKPIIAAIEGQAIGIGVTMLLHCDFIYAGAASQLSLPFSLLGLCPEGGSSWLLPQLVGLAKANEWLLQGQPFSAQEAADAGLINATCPNGTALDSALATAESLARLPSASLSASKTLIRAQYRAQLHQVIDNEAALFAERLASAEAQAAFAQFFQRKKPS